MTPHLETPIVFLDTETTSLRPDRRIWEIGYIARQPDGKEDGANIFIDRNDLDLANADLTALRIGRFFERHPKPWPVIAERPDRQSYPETEALAFLAHMTEGAHLVGAVISFDADVLSRRMLAHAIVPAWHYHLIDVEAFAAGHLGAEPPWDSAQLTADLGVDVSDLDKHTALGDATWAMRIYDAVIAGRRGR